MAGPGTPPDPRLLVWNQKRPGQADAACPGWGGDISVWIGRRDFAAVYGTVVAMAKRVLLPLVPPREVTRTT